MCEVNAITQDNSVQVVCDCQQSGIVKIESDLASPSDDDELFNETALLDDEESEEDDGGEKSLLVGIIFALIAYLL